jgi:hypothetical protein
MFESTQRVVCGMRGHTLVRCFRKNRLSLRCLNCGFETAGWNIGSVPPDRHGIGLSFAARAPERAVGHVPR